MSSDTKPIYIVEALRTPFGSFRKSLAEVPAVQLAASVIKHLLQRTELDPHKVDEVIIGQVLQGGAGQAPARQAMLLAGLPDTIPAMTINKVCGSGLVSMTLAANSIMVGEAELILAGGMENMSLASKVLLNGEENKEQKKTNLMMSDGLQDAYSTQSMGEITEEWLEDHPFTREQQDDFAIASYKRAQAALKQKLFDDEIVPISVVMGSETALVKEDEEPFRCNFEKFSMLPTVFKKGGSLTQGNSSTINDGAALALIAGESAVTKYGLKPRAKLVASAIVSTSPALFAEADIGAIEKVVKKAGLTLDDIDLFEINEAFGVIALLTIEKLGIDPEKVNVNGGAVAIGHPIGASGGRLVATIIRELERRQLRYGLVVLCIGGGEAVSALIERV